MPQKLDKHRKPLPGFRVSPEQQQRMDQAYEERSGKKRIKLAHKKLKAQGFVMEKFNNYLKNLQNS